MDRVHCLTFSCVAPVYSSIITIGSYYIYTMYIYIGLYMWLEYVHYTMLAKSLETCIVCIGYSDI